MGLQSVGPSHWSNWWGPIREPYSGAWQQNVTLSPDVNVLQNSSVFSCVTGIATDIAKMRLKLMENEAGIYSEVESGSPFLSILRKQNRHQTRIEFLQEWMMSKLLQGNAYILKRRDARGMVDELYVLSPLRVKVLVAPNGDVYYECHPDNLSELPEVVTVPESEIIHDKYAPLYHRYCGISPLFACALSAGLGQTIQTNSVNFFGNGSSPRFVLIAPGPIKQDTADLLKSQFQANFSGTNAGIVAVLGDGLKLETVQLSNEASQLEEQLRWTVEDVARAFHYPRWKLTGDMPAYAAKPEVLTMQYYTDCLQIHIECIELLLDEGLGLIPAYNSELDTDNLWRMDTQSLYDTINAGKNWMTTNEQRFRANLKPVDGGDEIFKQQQDIPLSVAAEAHPALIANSSQPAPQQIPESTNASQDAAPAEEAKSVAEYIPPVDHELLEAYTRVTLMKELST
jgi:HK97 family phage portal protein